MADTSTATLPQTTPPPVTPNPGFATPADTSYASYEANRGFPQPSTTSTPPTPTDTSKAPAAADTTTLDTNLKSEQQQLDSANQDFQNEADSVHETLLNISNGSVPLSAGEQAQITGLQGQFQSLINDQSLVNKSATGLANVRGFQTGAAEYDPSFQVKTIGAIFTAGQNKIADLNVKMASAVADLTQSFEDKKFSQVKDAWAQYQDASARRTDALQTMVTNTQKAIKDAQDKAAQAQKDYYDRIQKPIDDIAAEAAKFGAPKNILSAIEGAKDPGSAIAAASGYLQDPTSLGGMYNAYANKVAGTGGTPMTPGDFVAAQKYAEALATAKANNAYSYANAYNAALAKANVDQKFAGSDKTQQALEKTYAATLLKELSNRSGGLSLQDQKVNQAIHLKALIDQNTTTKSDGSKSYKLTPQQYNELAMGMASLLSGSNTVSDSAREEINAKTAKGDFAGALQYITGTPQKGNTDAIVQNLIDSIDRQGSVAQQIRDQDVAFLHGLAPTDLDPERISALEKNLLPSYTNPVQNVEQANQQAQSSVSTYYSSAPKDTQSKIDQMITDGVSYPDIMSAFNLQ